MDRSIEGEAGPASECFCYDCGQLRLSLIADKSKCYGCGSTNIKTGKVGELDKQILKDKFYELRQSIPPSGRKDRI